MKRLYWTPPAISRRALTLVALLASMAVLAVEKLPLERTQPWYAEKLAAARLADQALRALKAEKLARGLAIDPATDPTGSGLIGAALTPVTSNTGYLPSKQTSVNPNFAALIVDWLHAAKLNRGDVVALGVSGSFPALNVAAYAAVQTLGLVPLVISSTSASEWGANHPELLWLDMEAALERRHVFGIRSIAASPGGIDDRGFGLSEEGLQLIAASMARSGVPALRPATLTEAIEQRLELYERHAGPRPIRAYINVGGGTASVGTWLGKKQFPPGLNTQLPRGKQNLPDSVMQRFLQRGVPVLHLTNVVQLARAHGMPVEPTRSPRPGEGPLFRRAEYNRWLAVGGIVIIVLALLALIRLGLAVRLLRKHPTRYDASPPEPMV